MSFQPILPMSGYGGWSFLNRTLEKQQETFARNPMIQRDTDYFRGRIGEIDNAETLIADRRLLRVALGAFGLGDDINNRAFLRKVLEDGTLDPKALSNRLADKRYLEFSRAFGFGDNAIPLSKEKGFGDRIVAAYRSRQFEVAVGEQDETMRLALALRRDLASVADRESSDRALWFTVMGNPPLRKVFETAYNLPRSFATLDLDQQLSVLRDRTQKVFGDSSLVQFRDPERIDQLVRRFILRAQMEDAPGPGFGGGSVALQLLQLSQARNGQRAVAWRMT